MLRRYTIIGLAIGTILFPIFSVILDVSFHKLFVSPSTSQHQITFLMLTLLQLNAFSGLFRVESSVL